MGCATSLTVQTYKGNAKTRNQCPPLAVTATVRAPKIRQSSRRGRAVPHDDPIWPSPQEPLQACLREILASFVPTLVSCSYVGDCHDVRVCNDDADRCRSRRGRAPASLWRCANFRDIEAARAAPTPRPFQIGCVTAFPLVLCRGPLSG